VPNYCYPKATYVVWDGTNITEMLDLFSYWPNPDVTAVGDQLHVNGIYPMDHVFPPGTVFVGTAPPMFYIEEDFAAGFNVIEPSTP
jgi:hypothetical protein